VLDRAKEQSLKHCEALVKGPSHTITHHLSQGLNLKLISRSLLM
jgi:hypothetical protein